MATLIGSSGPFATALKSVVRRSVMRPAAAERAAEELNRGLLSSVAAEVRWAFMLPRAWLAGVAVNLVLSLVWLLVEPVRAEGHRDWVILIGTYFASFILADVTTTNVLGVDHVRVHKGVQDGTPIGRILLIKNLALLVIVGVPTLVTAMVLTLSMESPARLAVTIPEVAVPMLSWLGIGNLVSVLLPVGYEPLVRRWRQRGDFRRTATWLSHLALPYALFYVADPIYGLPHAWFRGQVPALLNSFLGPSLNRSIFHIGSALLVWAVGSIVAVVFIRVRGLRIL